MEKIKIRTLADEMKSRTATEFIMKENVITNHPAEVISKVNEIIGWIREHDKKEHLKDEQ